MPGWLASILFAVVFVALLAFGYWVLAPNRPRTDAARSATPPPVDTPALASPAVQANPVLRNLEITGLRLVEDKQKAVLQFVVVNHSAADLGDVSAKAVVRTIGSKPETPPVTSFAFKTRLGPYESKDLRVPVETKLRVYELPDWQFLRAEVTP